jgi:FdhD protein
MKANNIIPHDVKHFPPLPDASTSFKLIGEAPLSIQIQGNPFFVGMRTPGEEIAHAAGFCLSEGIVESADDLASVGYADESNPDVVNVELTLPRWHQFQKMLENRGRGGPDGFGLGGQDTVEALCRRVPPLPEGDAIDLKKGLECLDRLDHHQALRGETRAAHATGVYTSGFELMTVSEDVGRHNGMDKAIGRLLLDRRLNQAGVLALSSRVSFELVQKAARARIPVILSVSRPTALAVHLASRLNMALACLSRGGGGYIFCGEHRFKT